MQNLVMDSTKLKKVDGYKEVFAALQSIERYSVVKKTEESHRRRGQPIGGGGSDAGGGIRHGCLSDLRRLLQCRTYKDARKRLKDMQKARGFFKGEFSMKERKAALQKDKEKGAAASPSASQRRPIWPQPSLVSSP